jgi:hypothetical protein
MGIKILSEEEVNLLKQKLIQASQRDFAAEIKHIVKDLETNLFLLGCSAVEDRL